MTIAISLQVGDGVVLGADSATSLIDPAGTVRNTYFSAEKIMNLRRGYPVGAVTYGIGGLRGRSVGRLAKDLRLRFSDEEHPWHLGADYTIEEVAGRVKEFFYDELYAREYANSDKPPQLGIFVAGYSAGAEHPESWELNLMGECYGPRLVYPQGQTGFLYNGEQGPIRRLIGGYSLSSFKRLTEAGLSEEEALNLLKSEVYLLNPAMPIQEAIDLVRFLVDLTCKVVRFRPGPPTVAGPVDLAAITYHEGFRWVARKHYYPSELNPPSGPELERLAAHVSRESGEQDGDGAPDGNQVGESANL